MSTYHHLLAAWQTNNRVTEFFVANLPVEVWSVEIPGSPQRSVRMLAGHIHNARCMWIKMVGRKYGVKAPRSVDRRRVTKKQMLGALKRSSEAMHQLLEAGLRDGGELKIQIPWSNIPSDVVHFMSYIIAHEAHHRGQIVLAARAAGHRLPAALTNGLWQWKQRHKEAVSKRV